MRQAAATSTGLTYTLLATKLNHIDRPLQGNVRRQSAEANYEKYAFRAVASLREEYHHVRTVCAGVANIGFVVRPQPTISVHC